MSSVASTSIPQQDIRGFCGYLFTYQALVLVGVAARLHAVPHRGRDAAGSETGPDNGARVLRQFWMLWLDGAAPAAPAAAEAEASARDARDQHEDRADDGDDAEPVRAASSR